MAVEVVPAVEVRKKLTPDDVEELMRAGELDPDKIYELIDGELIEVPPAWDIHNGAATNMVGALWAFAQKSGGRAYSAAGGFRVGPKLSNVREPDAGYTAPERAEAPGEHFVRGAPDLAVEVLSKGQYGEAYAKGKVREYFEAGAKLVWLLDYRRKEVRVYTPNSDTYTIMRGQAVLTLEPIIAGFSLKVADIFR